MAWWLSKPLIVQLVEVAAGRWVVVYVDSRVVLSLVVFASRSQVYFLGATVFGLDVSR